MPASRKSPRRDRSSILMSTTASSRLPFRDRRAASLRRSSGRVIACTIASCVPRKSLSSRAKVKHMPRIIGIDLGTTNSEAAYMEGGTPRIIPSAEGSAYGGKMFPSVVAFTKDGILVGEPAKRPAGLNPEKTVIQIKRKMGTDHKVRIDGKDYTPQEISAMVLRKIKTDAEAFLGQKVAQPVITVPAHFTDTQRKAPKDA